MARKIFNQRSLPVYAIAHKRSGKLVLSGGYYTVLSTKEAANNYLDEDTQTVANARLVMTTFTEND
jgi:hypothetical protein